MKPKQLLIIGFFFLSFCSSPKHDSSCSSPKHDFVSFELISYNYIRTYNPVCPLYLRFNRYAVISKDGNAFYYGKTSQTNEPLYFKLEVEKKLIDSILIASERQKEYLKNDMHAKYGTGPDCRIKINYCDGTYEVIYFGLGDVLFKYFGAIADEKKLEPNNDTIDFIKKRSELINIAWKEDSIHFNFPMPLQIVNSKYRPDSN